MILSDISIVEAIQSGSIVIKPFNLSDLQPASYDVHIGGILLTKSHWSEESIIDDCKLLPGDFILAGLLEHVAIDNTIACKIEGISSLGRQGITIHATSGFVDPGWNGILTLEIANISRRTFTLTKGMRIAQLIFYQLTKPAKLLYSGRYQGAKGPEEAKDI